MTTALAIVEPDEQISDLHRAQVAADQLFAVVTKVETKRHDLMLALQVERSGGEIHPDASDALKRRAALHRQFVCDFPRRAEIEIEDSDVELGKLKPELAAARARLDVLKAAAADEFAQTLIPRHRAAVAGIASALEALSAALAAEAAIHVYFAEAFPENSRSNRIPHVSGTFNHCRLDAPSSTASAWGRMASALLKAPADAKF